MSKMDELKALQARLDGVRPPRAVPVDWEPFAPGESYDDELVAMPQKTNGHAKSTAAIGPKPIVLRHISEIVAEQREPEWLIDDVIEKNVLAVIAGPRGTFKSFIALDWAMRMAMNHHPGIILSGEGAGLDRRISAWITHHAENTDLSSLPMAALEQPRNLNMIGEMIALREAIELLPKPPAFILIDTFSKFSIGIDENDNGEVAEFLGSLSGNLRDEYRCTVLVVAHTGHGETNRPRGASSLMSNPDAEYIVTRPDGQGMVVTVSRERFKDTPAMPPLAYEAQVIDLGRLDSRGKPVTSLALTSTDVPMMAHKRSGKNQEKAIIALREWARERPTVTHIASDDIAAIFGNQGLNRQRRPEALNYLVNIRVLTPSLGGYTIDRKMLP